FTFCLSARSFCLSFCSWAWSFWTAALSAAAGPVKATKAAMAATSRILTVMLLPPVRTIAKAPGRTKEKGPALARTGLDPRQGYLVWVVAVPWAFASFFWALAVFWSAFSLALSDFSLSLSALTAAVLPAFLSTL